MIVKNLYKNYGKKEVLKNVSFEINPQDKIGLVGQNGSGKSTLLKILTGEVVADSGVIDNSINVGHLRQEIAKEDYGLTIGDYIRKQTGLEQLENRLHELENNLDENNMDEYDEVLNKFLALDGYNLDANISALFNGLKLNKDQSSKIGELSGGEKIKVLLMSVLLSDHDLLLMDEPTNNLDIDSVEFLENYLKSSKKSMLIVSHDEVFLDNIADKTFELKNGELTIYPYKYSIYANMKESDYQKNLASYLETRAKQAEIKEKLEGLKSKNYSSSGKKASDNDKMGHDFKVGKGEQKSGSLVKKLTKELENTKVDPEFRKKENFQFFINESKGKTSLNEIVLSGLQCGYDSFVTPPISLTINHGDRVLIEGANGTGKTTVIKTIVGDIPLKNGNLKVGNGVKFGYIEQNTILNENNLTMFEYITKNLDNVETGFVFNVLKNFQIDYDNKNKRYVDFSAGERTKINLAKLALEKVNVLILDEPTNHLDIEATKILYEALDGFEGTIIGISHNRKLIEKLNPNIIMNVSTGKIKYNSMVNP